MYSNNSSLSFYISHLISNLISQFTAAIFQWPLFKITSIVLSPILHTPKQSPLKYDWVLSDHSFLISGFGGSKKRKGKVFNTCRTVCFIFFLQNIFNMVRPRRECSEMQRTCSSRAEEANTILQLALHLLSEWEWSEVSEIFLVLTNAVLRYGKNLGELSKLHKSFS